jgi:hypothetical protein
MVALHTMAAPRSMEAICNKVDIIHTMAPPRSIVTPITMTPTSTMAMVAPRTTAPSTMMHLTPWRPRASSPWRRQPIPRRLPRPPPGTIHEPVPWPAPANHYGLLCLISHQVKTPNQDTTPLHNQSLSPSTFDILRYTS